MLYASGAEPIISGTLSDDKTFCGLSRVKLHDTTNVTYSTAADGEASGEH